MPARHIYPADRSLVRRRVNHAITEQARFTGKPSTRTAVRHAQELSAGYTSARELTQTLTRAAGFKARKATSSGVEGTVTLFTTPDGDKLAIKFNREATAGSAVEKHNRANLISAGLGLGSIPVVHAGRFEVMPLLTGRTGNQDQAKILARLAQHDENLARLIVTAGVNDQIARFPDGHPGNLMFLLTRANDPKVTVFDRNTSFGKLTGERKLPHNEIFRKAVEVLGPEGTSQVLSEGMHSGVIVAHDFPDYLGDSFARQALEGVSTVPSGIIPVAAPGLGLPSDWRSYMSPAEIADIERILLPVRASGLRFFRRPPSPVRKTVGTVV